eukprot:gnl/MRDRNA2_/MRDRNA2_85935_c0_seq2.p1 gnl/MRDRNA2_/MRDRNA2_85935_c0~~gnl/MRDRNA2_/MRDRNA2_85935_c0_seq2.p1  ORF type:complete len:407 (+),score=114.09 gnl/MRDRNA2_/MRDRNA2_85935_c0_seq2:114-1334(+)
MKKLERSASSPAVVAASYNLRQFSRFHRCPSKGAEAVPLTGTKMPEAKMAELLCDLKGGNGHWKQERAKEQYAQEMKSQEEAERKARLKEARRLNQEALQLAKLKKLQDEEMRRNKEREERERKQREAELAVLKAKQEEEKHIKRCYEQLHLLKQPRPCNTCKGSGKCIQCDGRGFFEAVYLSSVTETGRKHDQFHGRTRRGCPTCGGCKTNEDAGTVLTPLLQCKNPIAGTGLCTTCAGSGKTKLNKVNIAGEDATWLEEIQSLMRQMPVTELGKLLADKYWIVRLVAPEMIQEQGKAEPNVHQIAPLLKDKHWRVQVAAALAMGSAGAGTGPYLPDLIELFKDRREEVRNAAVKGLANCAVALPKTKQEDAVKELTPLQYDKNEEIAVIARNALQKVKESREDK